MSLKRKTIFISDIHLSEFQKNISKLFFSLLESASSNVDAIYILGDLFETWIGDDDLTRFHRQVIQALKTSAAKLPIYFLHGNRDFLIGKTFLETTGCHLLGEEEKINLYGTPVLLMHGDSLCTKDTAYIKARKKMRNPLVKKLFLLQPLTLRRYIANKMRKNSERYLKTAPLEIMDVVQTEVENVMTKHGSHYLIHGHTHKPAIHPFTLNDHAHERIVLGAWHDSAKILVWDETARKELIEINIHDDIKTKLASS